MTQLRKINASGDTVNPEHVRSVEWLNDGAPLPCDAVLINDGIHRGVTYDTSARQPAAGIVSTWGRAKVEYILTMRDPRRHMDPLPEWMERPEVTIRGGNEELGVLQRRSGDPALASDEGLPPSGGFGSDEEREWHEEVAARSEATSAGWDAQHQIAIDFYDAHTVGYNHNGD